MWILPNECSFLLLDHSILQYRHNKKICKNLCIFRYFNTSSITDICRFCLSNNIITPGKIDKNVFVSLTKKIIENIWIILAYRFVRFMPAGNSAIDTNSLFEYWPLAQQWLPKSISLSWSKELICFTTLNSDSSFEKFSLVDAPPQRILRFLFSISAEEITHYWQYLFCLVHLVIPRYG